MKYVVLLTTLLLAACGGGGGSDNDAEREVGPIERDPTIEQSVFWFWKDVHGNHEMDLGRGNAHAEAFTIDIVRLITGAQCRGDAVFIGDEREGIFILTGLVYVPNSAPPGYELQICQRNYGGQGSYRVDEHDVLHLDYDHKEATVLWVLSP